MIKVEALFTVPDDKPLFLSQVQEDILPFLYQMPYIEKIELTPCYDTPLEVQSKFLAEPIYYQIAVYYREVDEMGKSFETDPGKDLSEYLRIAFQGKLISAIGEAKIFYKSDLEGIHRRKLFLT